MIVAGAIAGDAGSVVDPTCQIRDLTAPSVIIMLSNPITGILAPITDIFFAEDLSTKLTLRTVPSLSGAGVIRLLGLFQEDHSDPLSPLRIEEALCFR